MQTLPNSKNATIPNPPPDVRNVLQHFVDHAQTFEASADGLVSVRVNASMSVIDLKIADPKLDAAMTTRIEAAAIAAVNSALRKAVLGARFAITQAHAKQQPGENAGFA